MWRNDSLEKTLMLGKVEGERMRWLDGITDSMEMSLSKPWEATKNRKSSCATVHGVANSQTRLSDWTATIVSLPQNPLPACTFLPTRDWTHPPWLEAQNLNLGTIREVSLAYLSIRLSLLLLLNQTFFPYYYSYFYFWLEYKFQEGRYFCFSCSVLYPST